MLDLVLRTPSEGDDIFSLRPGLRLDYSRGRFTFDAEAAYEWMDGERFPEAGEESGYTLLFGVRYDL
jgi:hypothetical protein